MSVVRANMTPHVLVTELITVSGIVQGVGFRPFVHRLAVELGLVGHVGNDSARVFIEISGMPDELDTFAGRLITEAPPLSMIETVERTPSTSTGATRFVILESRPVAGERTLVPPDTAVCDDCLAELRDPTDRRHGHPFITCTNCGPRFTIIRDLPYDRPNTTMAGFEMCDACAAEYRDPTDRRYHAQPISCHDCGPTLGFSTIAAGKPIAVETDPITAVERTAEALRDSRIVALKGLGGFHLVCDATSDTALATLRDRKRRADKPFAVIVRDLEHAAALAHIEAAEADLLCSSARPIVLLQAREGTALSSLVAPGNPLLGVMLAYTPVHHLLFDLLFDDRSMPPLVMTSGNVGGTPITFRDVDVAERLGPLCDALLTHDRPIHVPCDDSVVRAMGDRLMPIRRARGYAPVPVSFPRARRRVLAVGGELKSTFCLTGGTHAWVSQHIGDMENLETLDAFAGTVKLFEVMYAVTPDVVVADAHPRYLSSRWARTSGRGPVLEVQHHHAHVAAVMAEHNLDPTIPVIGFAFDGTGYGSDGTIWGGEVLVADVDRADRAAHLAYVPLPGGDAAIRHPCRAALAHLAAAGIEWTADLAPVIALNEIELGLLRRQLDRNVACIPTSSMGRLFDAVSSLLGLRHHVSYEAQAALDLEFAAMQGRPLAHGYRFTVRGPEVDPSAMLQRMVLDLRLGATPADIARTFHVAVADLVGTVAETIRSERHLATVALTGGVFQNRLLTELCVERLERAGFTVLTHRVVPPNDGGLALGQAYIAAHRTEPTATSIPTSKAALPRRTNRSEP